MWKKSSISNSILISSSLLILLILAIPSPSSAQYRGGQYDGTAFANESVTCDSTSGGISLTAATYGTAIRAFTTLESAEIRFLLTGGDPIALNGNLLEPGQWLVLNNLNAIIQFRCNATGSTSGILRVQYFR